MLTTCEGTETDREFLYLVTCTRNKVTSSERYFDSDDSNWNFWQMYVPLMTGTGTPLINFLL